MDREEFVMQLQALRRGELTLPPPEDNRLSRFAGGWPQDLKQYISALEAGYRVKTGKLAAYRSKARGRSLGEIVRDQWSDGAALGYAVMGLNRAGFSPDETVRVLEAMEEAMQVNTLQEAAEAHQALLEGGRHG